MSSTSSHSRELLSRPPARRVPSAMEETMQCVHGLFLALMKIVIHHLYGEAELVRICLGGDHGLGPDPIMVQDFAVYLSKSRQLQHTSKDIFELHPFSLFHTKKAIVEAKHLTNHNSQELLDNLSHCLETLKVINLAYTSLTRQRDTPFSYEEPEHVELLESLWTALLPDQPRSQERFSREWSKIGFQGLNPATDFRGMGILSLTQLVYFAQQHPEEARDLLALSNQPGKVYFPFAATGINVTAFVLQLFKDKHLHMQLIRRLHNFKFHRRSSIAEDFNNSSSAYNPMLPQEDPSQTRPSSAHLLSPVHEDLSDTLKESQEHALFYVHEAYCEVYFRFGLLWRDERPRDVMDFPRIFGKLREEIEQEFPPLV